MRLVGGAGFLHLSCFIPAAQGPWSHSRKNPPTGNLDEGFFRYERFSYRVTSTPAVFQRKTDEVQQEVDGVSCYLDDIQTFGGIQRNIYKTWRKF